MKTGRDIESQRSPDGAWPIRPRRTGEGAASALEQLKQEHSEAAQPSGPAGEAFNADGEQSTPA